jgi:galactose mutarotase-like enzyme
LRNARCTRHGGASNRHDSRWPTGSRAWRARIRARYVFEDIEDNQYLEQFVSMYTDLTYRLRKKNLLRMRYDIRFWLDERVNTMARTPSPEHWFWLELESRF